MKRRTHNQIAAIRCARCGTDIPYMTDYYKQSASPNHIAKRYCVTCYEGFWI